VLVVKVTMMAGRTAEQEVDLIHRLTDAAMRHLDWPLDDVRVIVYEVSKDDWGIAGQSVTERERDSQAP
jgi:4-oxalocrotonate tautomerase